MIRLYAVRMDSQWERQPAIHWELAQFVDLSRCSAYVFLELIITCLLAYCRHLPYSTYEGWSDTWLVLLNIKLTNQQLAGVEDPADQAALVSIACSSMVVPGMQSPPVVAHVQYMYMQEG